MNRCFAPLRILLMLALLGASLNGCASGGMQVPVRTKNAQERTEEAVQEYTARWLQPADQGIPQRLLVVVAMTPPQNRLKVLPANLSPIGKLAILREAQRQQGN